MAERIRKYDFNRDGQADRVVGTKQGEEAHVFGEVTAPDGSTVKIGKYDKCNFQKDLKMWKKGAAWFVDDPKILFYGSAGKDGFFTGEKVLHNGVVKEIIGFRVMINGLKEYDSRAVAIFNNCEWAELDELKKI